MKIVSIINTSGLIYDDRLIKEVETIKTNNQEVEIVAFEKKNSSGRGKFHDIPYRTLHMRTRKWFPKPKKFLSLKAIEFTFLLLWQILKRPRTVLWIHNMEMMGLVTLAILLKKMGYFKGVVWDQHEFPINELRKSYALKIYTWCCSNCTFVVFANQSRVAQMEKIIPILKGKFLVINNFPTIEIAEMPTHLLEGEILNWLNNEKYILFQGVAKRGRSILECSRAVQAIANIKFVIVGPIEKDIEEEIKTIFGDEFNKRVYIVGMVPQEKLYYYLDNCLLSLVFYKNENLNNWLCEPNRFYQAMARQKPIVCGANPSMKEIVSKYQCGFALEEDDGSDYLKIQHGIEYVLKNYEKVTTNLNKSYKELTWDANDEVFQKIFEKCSR